MKFFYSTKSRDLNSVFSHGKLLPLFVLVFSLVFTSCKKSIEESAGDGNNSSGQSSSNRGAANSAIGINVLLTTPVTDKIVTELNTYGTVIDIVPAINALTMRTESANLAAIKKLSYVSDANPDVSRNGSPIDAVAVTDFSNGISTWNLDAINVTDAGKGRTIAKDGSGVFVGVLDTGLPDSWRQYFPEERIATQYAKSFGGGGGENGNVSEQPNKWEHDQNTHGGHVTSTIIGFQLGTAYVNGVAPKATIIPVKVLNQNGSGWSSVIARGIVYMAELKMGALHSSPVVINMSLGGPGLDALEKAAIDYAISKGVIIVASAGNSGDGGMGYPGAYQPVISVASAGWIGQWTIPGWWYAGNVPDPTNPADLFVSDFSSRQKTGQDLDVVAPGENVVGPYQVNSGQISYYYLSGTSMASPHVAGIVALMAQQKPSLTAALAETTLENAAKSVPLGAGSRKVLQSNGTVTKISWPLEASGNGFITATAALGAL
ncbi:MAG: Subtilisin [Segetibacter sp.]|nr:Subtilisin [Segetibacter sp.]